MFGLLSYLRAMQERRTSNSSSIASDLARLRLSDSNLRRFLRLCPSLYLTSGPGRFIGCYFGDGLGAREFIRDIVVHGSSGRSCDGRRS